VSGSRLAVVVVSVVFGFWPWGAVARGSDRVDQERDAAPDSGGYQAFALQDGEWQCPDWSVNQQVLAGA
jgi:hypothetical protein